MKNQENIQANYPVYAWGGSPVLNETFALYYQKDPTFLNQSQVVSELNAEFVGVCEEAPTVQLNPQTAAEVIEMFNKAYALGSTNAAFANVEKTLADPPNISLTMEKMKISIYDYESGTRGKLLGEDTFKIITYGIFAVDGSKLILNSLSSVVSGGTGGDSPLMQKVVNGYVLPAVTKRYSGITLPQFQNLFGSDLNASIASVAVSNQQFDVYANIAPTTFASQSLDSEITAEDADSIINAYVSGEAVQLIASKVMKPMSSPFSKESGGSFGGAGIKGTIYMGQPGISINGSSASASAPISISMEGGVKAFWNWVWVPLPVPDTNVVIDISLTDDGTNAYIEITGVQSIHVDLGDWPSVLKPVESAIEGLLDAVVGLFRGTISNAVSGTKLGLFSLPDVIPGMDVPADLTFNSLGFANSGVQTAIEISGTS